MRKLQDFTHPTMLKLLMISGAPLCISAMFFPILCFKLLLFSTQTHRDKWHVNLSKTKA